MRGHRYHVRGTTRKDAESREIMVRYRVVRSASSTRALRPRPLWVISSGRDVARACLLSSAKRTSSGIGTHCRSVPEVDVVWHGRSRSRPAPSKPTTLTFIARRGMGGRYVELWGETDAH